VTVLYDDRGVPHVFASSEEDAWRAQGYVVARDRLFQLELQTRSAAGTLSELLGPRARDVDLETRRRGFRWAAERNFRAIDSGSIGFRAARAYASGVNAWIDQQRRGEVPLEYRLVNARPARWEPINTFYLFLQMSHILAWSEPTIDKLEARALVGTVAAEALFPVNNPIQEPIQPNGQDAPRYAFGPLPPPGAPDTLAMVALGERTRFGAANALPREAVGSNNWAVAPGRTAGRAALLAGDPHLSLSLPSVWYEIHLQVDGGPEVAGVTFAGSPGVIIGFNRNVAWSFTNTGADVLDYYRETVDDAARPTRYQLDGEWASLELREEIVRGRRGEVVAVDTVRFTHRGPLTQVQGRWLSIRWTVWDAGSTGSEFLRLNRAGNVANWLSEWEDFAVPAQNGIVADRAGHIGIRSTGRYPIRPGDGRGDEIRDGSTREADWTGFLPVSRYPFALDPPQGFLASANQQPVDPRVNPAYFGADWFSPWRAIRINQLLRADSGVTPDAMRQFQTDPSSPRAEAFLPFLIAAAGGAGDSTARKAAAILSGWDGKYLKESEGAALFEATMALLNGLVWDELIPPGRDTAARPVAVPADAILLALIGDSASRWWDDRRTAAVENRDAMLVEALKRGYQSMAREWGPPGSGWRWDRVHHANIWHLLRIPGLSALDLAVSGGPSTLSPSPGNGTHGASWRMVAELGQEVRASGIYPGGQSGNPASARYDDRLSRWLAGALDPILFPARAEDLPADRLRSTLTLRPPAP
jgi:penicillin amidase